jgi:single-stranded-DNA-specific exonuclease
MLAPKLHLHCEVPLDEIDAATLEAQDLLEPFGSHNARPVFFSRGVTPAAAPRVMKEKHLRIEFASGRRKIAAVYFNAPLDAMPRPPWDIAYTLEWNHWQGRSEPQIQIMEIRSSE